MRIIKKIKRVMFGIHEAVWWIVAEIEDWLYPYYDRPVAVSYTHLTLPTTPYV